MDQKNFTLPAFYVGYTSDNEVFQVVDTLPEDNPKDFVSKQLIVILDNDKIDSIKNLSIRYFSESEEDSDKGEIMDNLGDILGLNPKESFHKHPRGELAFSSEFWLTVLFLEGFRRGPIY